MVDRMWGWANYLIDCMILAVLGIALVLFVTFLIILSHPIGLGILLVTLCGSLLVK